MVVDPFQHLLGTKLLLTHIQEELFHLRAIKTEQIDFLLDSHGILQSGNFQCLYTSLPRPGPWQTELHR